MKRLNISLKTKITVGVSLIVAGITAALAFYSLSYFQQQLRENIAAQQFVLLSSIAGHLDDQLVDARNELVNIAKSLPLECLADAARAQHFLDARGKVETNFDYGLFLFSREGLLIAESPFTAGRRGKNFAFRDYFKTTLSSAKPVISAPFLSSKANRHPVVMFTAPIISPAGDVVGLLGGSVDLTTHNFLGKLAHTTIGKSGYLFLFNTDRTMIMHPDEKRILAKDVPWGVNQGLDKAVAGFEGTVETVNSKGTPMLSTFKNLTATNWILAANLPQAEAYAAIDRARRYLAAGLLAAIFLSVGVVWFYMKLLIAPLQRFASHVRSFGGKRGAERLFYNASGDEIGILAEAFNGMVKELDDERVALSESEERFRAMFSRACDGISIISAGKLVDVNQSLAAMHGYSVQEMQQMELKDLDTPDSYRQVPELIQRILAGERFIFEIEHYHKDGHIFPLEVSASLICSGGEQYIQCFYRDITERKRTEAVLCENEEKLSKLVNEQRIILNTASVGICFLRDRKVLWANPGFDLMFGYVAGTSRNIDTAAFYADKESYEDIGKKGYATLGSGDVYSQDVKMIKKNGSPIWCNLVGQAVIPGKAMDGDSIWIFNDISERRMAEKILNDKNSELEQFAYTVSHDLKSPLITIQSYVGMIIEDMEAGNNSRVQVDMKKIGSAAAKMAALLDDLLELSRSGRSMCQPAPVDMNCLIKDTLMQLSGSIKQSHAEVVVQPDLPAVLGDRERIAEVVQNLIENAIKYMGEQVLPRIEVGTRNDGQTKVFFVSDNGMGIEPRFHEKIFCLFNKLDGKSEGTGVGLALVQRIIEVHGGRVWVESDGAGKGGSTFCFSLTEFIKENGNTQ